MKKNKLTQWFFRQGQRRLLQNAFFRLDVYTVTPQTPVLVLVNHSSFYDSLVLFELERSHILPPSIIAVMHAQGLTKHKIFRGLGVVPVSSPVKLSEFKQLVTLMHDHSLLLFPQGKEEHVEKRPLTIEKGAATLLAKHPQHGILFISLYYSFTDQKRGRIACRMHHVPATARPHQTTALHSFIAQTMTEQLDVVKEHAIHQTFDGYIRL